MVQVSFVLNRRRHLIKKSAYKTDMLALRTSSASLARTRVASAVFARRTFASGTDARPLEGKVIDVPVVKRARALLELAGENDSGRS